MNTYLVFTSPARRSSALAVEADSVSTGADGSLTFSIIKLEVTYPVVSRIFARGEWFDVELRLKIASQQNVS